MGHGRHGIRIRWTGRRRLDFPLVIRTLAQVIFHHPMRFNIDGRLHIVALN